MGQEQSTPEEPKKSSKKLSKEQKKELNVKRARIAKEIMTTENVYVNNLTLTQSVYLFPLREMASKGKPIIKEEQIDAIFSILEELRTISKKILDLLIQRIETWHDKSLIGDIFIEQSEALRVYTNYINNYDKALSTLAACSKKGSKFAAFIDECQDMPESRRMDLPTFLIMPIQRIPRYELLLRDLLKATPRKHKDYKNINRALQAIKGVAEYINSQKRNYESMQELLQLQNQMDQKHKENIAEVGRVILKNAEWDGAKGGRKFGIYLLNDCFMIIEKQKAMMSKAIKVKVRKLVGLDVAINIQGEASSRKHILHIRFGDDENEQFSFIVPNEIVVENWQKGHYLILSEESKAV